MSYESPTITAEQENNYRMSVEALLKDMQEKRPRATRKAQAELTKYWSVDPRVFEIQKPIIFNFNSN